MRVSTSRERGRQRKKEKQIPRLAGNLMPGSIPGRCDHDGSRKQMLDQPSHPGPPAPETFKLSAEWIMKSFHKIPMDANVRHSVMNSMIHVTDPICSFIWSYLQNSFSCHRKAHLIPTNTTNGGGNHAYSFSSLVTVVLQVIGRHTWRPLLC
ncbi:hypothetical protein VULLAG_LOCUS13481 [Vulpes lagopus]